MVELNNNYFAFQKSQQASAQIQNHNFSESENLKLSGIVTSITWRMKVADPKSKMADTIGIE